MAMWDKIKAIGATLVGGGGGAMAGGPVGLAIGGIAGAAVDYLRVKFVKTPLSVAPSGGAVPPGANLDAASKATTLMLVATATGHTGDIAPARYWLTQFQTSVNLPATGSLDPQTRASLIAAIPSAAQLPPVTVLG